MVSDLRLCAGREGELHEGSGRGHAAVVQVVAKRSRRMRQWVLESGRLDLTATAIVGDPAIRLLRSVRCAAGTVRNLSPMILRTWLALQKNLLMRSSR